MAWTEQMVEDLRKMWKEGLTTGEIGRRLNVSKNSIVGKVHRLGLSGRPSPIKKKNENETTQSTTENKTQLNEKKVSETNKSPSVKTEKKTPIKEENTAKVLTTVATPTETNKEKENVFSRKEPEKKHSGFVSLTELDSHTCRWPIGDPKDENFHFCGKKIKIGQTYCEEHAAIAYVKPTKK